MVPVRRDKVVGKVYQIFTIDLLLCGAEDEERVWEPLGVVCPLAVVTLVYNCAPSQLSVAQGISGPLLKVDRILRVPTSDRDGSGSSGWITVPHFPQV